jgi:hypothetical protein
MLCARYSIRELCWGTGLQQGSPDLWLAQVRKALSKPIRTEDIIRPIFVLFLYNIQIAHSFRIWNVSENECQNKPTPNLTIFNDPNKPICCPTIVGSVQKDLYFRTRGRITQIFFCILRNFFTKPMQNFPLWGDSGGHKEMSSILAGR